MCGLAVVVVVITVCTVCMEVEGGSRPVSQSVQNQNFAISQGTNQAVPRKLGKQEILCSRLHGKVSLCVRHVNEEGGEATRGRIYR